MRLPHHPEIIDTLRQPTPEEPWRVLISGCLFGLSCGVDGTDYGLAQARAAWLSHSLVTLVPFCPEDHGIGTPRTMPDLYGGDGFDVLDGTAEVMDEHRTPLTDQMLAGAREMLKTAQVHQIDFAVLTDRSAACGSQVISIGCRYEEPVHHQRGVGVATALLLRNGFHVVSQRDFRTMALLGARLNPHYAPETGVVDHHRHPWVLANLPL